MSENGAKMELEDFLKEITESDGVAGFEENVSGPIARAFAPYVDETRRDNLGNLIFYKKGKNAAAPRVMFCAHMDEIGLIVTGIEERGFLRFSTLGGFDARTLPGQEVTVYGKEKYPGVIGHLPPHLCKGEQKKKAPEIKDLFIDTGLPEDVVRAGIDVGAVVALRRNFVTLRHRCRAGKAFDDRAGVALLWQCARELSRMDHAADVFLVATVQEEVGTRGAVVSTFGLAPDLGVAVDVCHGDFPGAAEHEVSPLGKGPVITSGPNIHPCLFERLRAVAADYHLPCELDVSPGPTGTDARAIQVSREGIPAALLSVPLRYMHTSVELLDLDDLKTGGRLLAFFTTSLDRAFVEGLACF
ncbi:MAG: M42 family metallopeptidase [Bacillota bacterium]